MAVVQESLDFNEVELDDIRLSTVKNYCGETPEKINQTLNELKCILTGNSSFQPCLDDNFLLRFLRAARYRPMIVVKRLKTYYFSRNTHPEIFQNYLPSSTLRAQALNHIKALPHRARNLSAVVVIKLGKVDFQNVPFLELLRLELIVFEILMQNSITQLCGITVIIDCGGFSPADLSNITSCLPTCYNVFHYDCTLGIKYLHVVNTPILLQLLYQNLISAWPQEQQTQVVFHPPSSSLEELHNQVSTHYLPEEYGGTLSSSNLVDLNPMVNEKENYFREQLRYGISTDELELD